MTQLSIQELTKLVATDGVAIRVRQRLQPAGGPGDKVFPPTYARGDRVLKYAEEVRRVDGHDVTCVLLDSVASQANRMEEALQAAWEANELDFPVVGVDFTGDKELVDLGVVTTLQAPHRIADAILRDATDLGGKTLFRDLAEGRAFTEANVKNATAVLQLCPTALLLGVWDSTGPKGGLGSKFQRALSSEIVAVGVKTGSKVGSRIDPLAVGAHVPVYHRKDDRSDWTTDLQEALHEKGKPVLFSRGGSDGKGKPSAINHSNVAPSVDEYAGGVTFDYALQTTVLSLAALRKLRFVTDVTGTPLADRTAAERAARVALAALGIAAIVAQRGQGYDLRSRCLLVPDGPLVLEALGGDGVVTAYSVDAQQARGLVRQAGEALTAVGLAWKREPLKLKPAPKLVALIKKSRADVAAGAAEEAP